MFNPTNKKASTKKKPKGLAGKGGLNSDPSPTLNQAIQSTKNYLE
jgi:hypothetical protein